MKRLGRPLLFLLLALLPLVFSTDTVDAFEYPKVALLLLTALALLALGVPALASAPAPSRRALLRAALREPTSLGALLFCLSALASTATSISPRTSLNGAPDSFAGFWTFVALAVVFFATRALLHSAADAERLLHAPVIAAAGASAYALAQAAGHDPLPWQRLTVFAGYTRPFGTLGHPNLLGAFLAMAFPLAVHLACGAARRGRRSACAAHALTAAAAAVVVVLSASRGAWLALLAATAVLAAGWGRPGLRRGATAAALPVLASALTVLALATPAGSDRLAGLVERARHLTEADSRRQIWGVALRVFAEHPILGCGLDTFQLAFAARRPATYWLSSDWYATPTKAHDDLLHVLATQGLVGGLAAGVFSAGSIRAGLRAWRRPEQPTRPGAGGEPETAALATAVLASVTAFYAQGLFGFSVAATASLFAAEVAVLSRLGAGEDTAFFPAGRATRPRPNAGRDPLVLHLATWPAAAALCLAFVVQPFRANLACARGMRLLGADPEAAVEAQRRAVALDPTRDLYWAKLGMAAQLAATRNAAPDDKRRLLRLAREAYERAVGLVPSDATHRMRLARLTADEALAGLASRDAALAACDGALQMDPRNAYLSTTAANAALALGDFARVRRYAEQTAALYPRFATPHFHLGAVALAEGRPEEAVRELEAAFYGEWHGEEQEGRWRAADALRVAFTKLGRSADAERYARYARDNRSVSR